MQGRGTQCCAQSVQSMARPVRSNQWRELKNFNVQPEPTSNFVSAGGSKRVDNRDCCLRVPSENGAVH